MSCHLKRDRLNRWFQYIARQRQVCILPDSGDVVRETPIDHNLIERIKAAKLRLKYG